MDQTVHQPLDRNATAPLDVEWEEAAARAILAAASEEDRELIHRAVPDWPTCRRVLASRRRIDPEAPDASLVPWARYYASLHFERIPFQMEFRRMLLDEPGAHGRVLDVGAGSILWPILSPIRHTASQLDGVDPSPAIQHHPFLDRRWHSTLEDADVPQSSYDLAYSFNVVEHVPAARPFFEKLRRVLKPGGVYLAMTPHAIHPFSLASRLVQALSARKWAHRRRPQSINPYPAYYRLNSRRSVLRAIEGLGFSSARFWYHHASWSSYLPRGLRWTSSVYDHLLARPIKPLRLILMFRLQVADSNDESGGESPVGNGARVR